MDRHHPVDPGDLEHSPDSRTPGDDVDTPLTFWDLAGGLGKRTHARGVEERAAREVDNRAARRGLLWWMARATTSLPVPVSPVMRIVLLVAAIVSRS